MRKPKPPARDYTSLRTLGLRGWFKELTRLREQALEHNPKLVAADPKIAVYRFSGARRVFLPGAPIVQLIEPQDRDVRIPRHLLPAIIVNISAPEQVIVAQFKRTLREALDKYPQPLRKPGPHAANYFFDERIFKRWCNARIVEFADRLAWNAKLGKPCSETRLGATFLKHRDKYETARVKKMLMRAIAALPALAAQLKYDTDSARRAEYLKEAEGMVDPDDLETARRWTAEEKASPPAHAVASRRIHRRNNDGDFEECS
jgi:hypothetical protein